MLHCFKDTGLSDRIIADALHDEGERWNAIRCPHCGWHPTPSSRWSCNADHAPEPFFHGCGTVWNTFDTKGRCPGCQHQWQWTSCLSCGKWSPHVDWYDESNDDAD
jgi:hypothetical protein